jgi:hypothetical protein
MKLPVKAASGQPPGKACPATEHISNSMKIAGALRFSTHHSLCCVKPRDARYALPPEENSKEARKQSRERLRRFGPPFQCSNRSHFTAAVLLCESRILLCRSIFNAEEKKCASSVTLTDSWLLLSTADLLSRLHLPWASAFMQVPKRLRRAGSICFCKKHLPLLRSAGRAQTFPHFIWLGEPIANS